MAFGSTLRGRPQENSERGILPEEARYAAMRKFGNVTRVKEEIWAMWSFVWLEQFAAGIWITSSFLNRPVNHGNVTPILKRSELTIKHAERKYQAVQAIERAYDQRKSSPVGAGHLATFQHFDNRV
jgi:hypothetical protein